MINLDTPIEDVPRIGINYQKKLKKLGIQTVQDLLFYFPQRYDDFSDVIEISQVQAGNTICVQGEIIETNLSRTFKRGMNIIEITVQDGSGEIKALWFNQPFLEKTFRQGDFVCLAGKASLGKKGIYLSNPVHEKIGQFEENEDLTHTARIIPVYGETKGVSSRWLRYIIKPLLTQFIEVVPEILPKNILEKYKFMGIQNALWQVHFPDSFEAADAAKARFSFEELFILQLSVLREKAKLLQKKAPNCPMDADLMKKFTASLPFELTASQKQCTFAILKDLEKEAPMSRLLEGDVGSGKTVVAAMCALNVVKCGYQVAFMAPTEILATQHYKSISNMLKTFGVSVELLTGKTLGRKKLLEKLFAGKIDILIGTHALISKGVEFKNLALVVLDEQHRFGVAQRAHLVKNKQLIPHLLSMTATPIPRTLALTVYGDLDLSLIKEMPKNRKKIQTLIVEPKQRKEAYQFITSEIKKGRGVFVICPKIDSTKTKLEEMQKRGPVSGSFIPQNYNVAMLGVTEIKSVKEEYEQLSKEIFPDFNVTMLHGKMKPKEKERIMLDFKNGQIDVLVSTSVVEVGVDVPRATVMMIEGAERFGLAQLHQFRGRVGRSDMQSYCFLFTTSPDQLNRKRLKALVDSSNGFELAQKDLEIRGPGQVYGYAQWGLPDMAMQGLSNIFLVEKTRAAAKEVLEKDINLADHPLLKERVNRLRTQIHFE